MEKEFVPYELAIRMKDLGFNEPCFASYYKHGEISLLYSTQAIMNDNINSKLSDVFVCTLPTWQLAFDWFKRIYNYYSTANYGNLNPESLAFYLEILIKQAEQNKFINNN
jgi:hypothetical protein